MKKRIWKVCALMVMLALCASLLAACGGNTAPASENGNAESVSVSTGTEDQQEGEQQESVSSEESSENSSYDPTVTGTYEDGSTPEFSGEMVIYRPWANFTIFYGDFRYSDELVLLGKVESGLEALSSKTDDFTGVLELAE